MATENLDYSSAHFPDNIEWNRQRWGTAAAWESKDGYGYRWGRGLQQSPATTASFCDTFLAPAIRGRYDLKILEISPGAGRITAELLRFARAMCLVDLNEAAIGLCRQRFQFVPTPITYLVNDGQSLAEVPDDDYDLVVCFDSMVHMHPEIIRGYVLQMAEKMTVGGLAWLDHSGKGKRETGSRTAMTAELMVSFADEAGLGVVDQTFRNDWDCISLLERVER